MAKTVQGHVGFVEAWEFPNEMEVSSWENHL